MKFLAIKITVMFVFCKTRRFCSVLNSSVLWLCYITDWIFVNFSHGYVESRCWKSHWMKDFIAALFEGELLIVKLNYLVPTDTSLRICSYYSIPSATAENLYCWLDLPSFVIFLNSPLSINRGISACVADINIEIVLIQSINIYQVVHKVYSSNQGFYLVLSKTRFTDL